MGNVDTKLNFRKAIVQLGAKNQVSYNNNTEFIDFFFIYYYRFDDSMSDLHFGKFSKQTKIVF